MGSSSSTAANEPLPPTCLIPAENQDHVHQDAIEEQTYLRNPQGTADVDPLGSAACGFHSSTLLGT